MARSATMRCGCVCVMPSRQERRVRARNVCIKFQRFKYLIMLIWRKTVCVCRILRVGDNTLAALLSLALSAALKMAKQAFPVVRNLHQYDAPPLCRSVPFFWLGLPAQCLKCHLFVRFKALWVGGRSDNVFSMKQAQNAPPSANPTHTHKHNAI